MGYIKEPAGINFIVDPTPLTSEDRQQISDAISFFKATGKKTILPKITRKKNDTKMKTIFR